MISNDKYIYMALSTKMSQLGHYEIIRTHGNVHLERSSRAYSPEDDFIDNVQNNKKVIKIRNSHSFKHIGWFIQATRARTATQTRT
jgi:hypothetical protein